MRYVTAVDGPGHGLRFLEAQTGQIVGAPFDRRDLNDGDPFGFSPRWLTESQRGFGGGPRCRTARALSAPVKNVLFPSQIEMS
jgi:hypothetical protein